MLVTEEDARTIVCHETMGATAFVNCLGPRCMAWRWKGIEIVRNDPRTTVRTGYCGKAGNPE